MNCERFEELLPAYLDGELSAGEHSEMEALLADSTELRESLALSRALEETLVMRREEVPPVDRFVTAIPHSDPAPEFSVSRAQRWLDAIVSVPALATIGCVVLGMWTFWHQDTIAALLGRPIGEITLDQRLGELLSLDGLGRSIRVVTDTMAGGDVLVLTGVYVAVTIAILGLTGFMTMRFVRN